MLSNILSINSFTVWWRRLMWWKKNSPQSLCCYTECLFTFGIWRKVVCYKVFTQFHIHSSSVWKLFEITLPKFSRHLCLLSFIRSTWLFGLCAIVDSDRSHICNNDDWKIPHLTTEAKLSPLKKAHWDRFLFKSLIGSSPR